MTPETEKHGFAGVTFYGPIASFELQPKDVWKNIELQNEPTFFLFQCRFDDRDQKKRVHSRIQHVFEYV